MARQSAAGLGRFAASPRRADRRGSRETRAVSGPDGRTAHRCNDRGAPARRDRAAVRLRRRFAAPSGIRRKWGPLSRELAAGVCGHGSDGSLARIRRLLDPRDDRDGGDLPIRELVLGRWAGAACLLPAAPAYGPWRSAVPARSFQQLAGWSLGEIAFLYGLRLVGHGLQLFVFGYIHMLEIYVREGLFDRFLVRPVPVLLHLVVSRFPVGAIGDFGSGILLFLIANSLVNVDWSPAALAFAALTVVGAALLEAGLKLMVASLSFRFLSTRSLVFVVDDVFNNFGNYPLKIFGGATQFFLTFGIPVAFIAYFPATVLLGRTGELAVSPVLAYRAPGAAALVFGLAILVWKHELPQYQSAGH